MKKQTVYQTMKLNKQVWIVEKQGYLYDIVYPEGTITVGLVFKQPYWFATHYESGLDCTPHSNKGSFEKKWRNREELLEAVKTLPFHSNLAKAKPFISLVNAYKKRVSVL